MNNEEKTNFLFKKCEVLGFNGENFLLIENSKESQEYFFKMGHEWSYGVETNYLSHKILGIRRYRKNGITPLSAWDKSYNTKVYSLEEIKALLENVFYVTCNNLKEELLLEHYSKMFDGYDTCQFHCRGEYPKTFVVNKEKMRIVLVAEFDSELEKDIKKVTAEDFEPIKSNKLELNGITISRDKNGSFKFEDSNDSLVLNRNTVLEICQASIKYLMEMKIWLTTLNSEQIKKLERFVNETRD